MAMLLLHVETAQGPDRKLAVNAKDILRMEEVEGSTTTRIIQSDKGPITVRESLDDILNALDEDVIAVKADTPAKAEAKPQAGQPIGHAHVKAGAK